MTDFALYMILPLLAGWLLDRLFGDPMWLPHPIVAFGKAISFAEKRWNNGTNKVQKGAVIAVLFPLVVFVVMLTVNVVLYHFCFWCGVAVNSLFVFFALAGKTLSKEVKDVFEAVAISLPKGREQIARIVGRDTSQLNEEQIKVAALETLSENLSDGVIAPLFWYAIGGTAGMLAYKMTNTLDSMLGYKSERYKDFGRWSAKIDDVANYIPARLTALLMIIVAGRPNLWKFVKKYGEKHSSPNAGYPESALAGILDCRFGGGNYYFGKYVEKPYIGETERDLTTADMRKAIRVNFGAEVLMVGMLFLFISIFIYV